ncbi:DUF2235 domain-containing protein [Thiohalobacter thiocyanaticus]|uniref:DUF2235 domain-containing protein n=1 Tax=Thiohalobacter thiocyanaticus TaxID=585455 RepID=A0A426QGA9_9GAMM|nr:DUF2235 domain-containing protein [Thiohalobacter thiocyanaticus]RRQ20788.1 DUF2235 domain-containing protein [Thiohalobacter thiocyanaticus]
MKKRIVICADGTWNRPEKDLTQDFCTNVLKLARAISPIGADGVPQQVFYDWGVGSYYDPVVGGATGKGLHKNIMDDYRYIVQNYKPGDELYLFGFSRGAYTVRCLCGLINNVGIVTRPVAHMIQQAFDHYKNPGRAYKPDGKKSIEFREAHSHPSRSVDFVGVWDTVGAMGIPISFLGLFDDKDEFYDTKLGRNVRMARHAMAIDERRIDFTPTVWQPRENMDIRQVWFAGAHSNVGGSYKPDTDGRILSDIPLVWMVNEATRTGLSFESHLGQQISGSPFATLHNSRRHFYRLRQEHLRNLDHDKGEVLFHASVRQRFEGDPNYRPQNLVDYLDEYGWPDELVE